MKLQVENQNGRLDVTVDGTGAHLNLESDHQDRPNINFTVEWDNIQTIVKALGRKLDEFSLGTAAARSSAEAADLFRLPTKVRDAD